MRSHPGTFKLESEHLDYIREAIKQRKESCPNMPEGFNTDQDYILARLLWLEWWMDWTLKNCERPAVHNH